MKGPVLGWDVGGANIKVARLQGDGHTAEVFECPFPLWREPHRLPAALAKAADHLGDARTMAVTMTAELADCFATKREGVAFVLDAFGTAFPNVEPWVFGTDGRFRSREAARRQPHEVAAANWVASAMLVTRIYSDALFLDVGSTTTDVIPIVAGRVAALGRTDPARLSNGELIYTGALRTPVCAIVRSVPLNGRMCRVAAEHFAVAADVHLWLGRIDARDYICETPDGRGPSRADAGARLARMVCADMETLGARNITEIAEHVTWAQVRQIVGGARQVIRRLRPARTRVAVLAGQGAFLARAAAEELSLDTGDMAKDIGLDGARVTPAVAVAYLLAEKVDAGCEV